MREHSLRIRHIDLAHSLGLKVTAEGVETATALALLQGMGCDIAQGYFIARPMPIADLIVRLDEPAVPVIEASVTKKTGRVTKAA